MQPSAPSFFDKLKWSLPWLSRYPLWRAGQVARRTLRTLAGNGRAHLILIVDNAAGSIDRPAGLRLEPAPSRIAGASD
jgi:hypothetical protein